MEPRHRVPEFHSEFELDYTDNAIYLILKRERVQPVDVGPQVTTARTTIQLCTDCMLTSNLFRNSLGERQTFLIRGFWETLEAENLFAETVEVVMKKILIGIN